MTVNEVVEFLLKCDGNAEVLPCDWGNTVAIRVWDKFHKCKELRWNCVEDNEITFTVQNYGNNKN